MWALFLVAFFTFLRKSNLVPDVASRISSKVPLRAHLVFDSHGATLHIAASKTIQYQQRSLSIPLPLIPGSPPCIVTALRHHLRLNPAPSTAPLFSVVCSPSQQLSPLTSRHFCFFIFKVISALGFWLTIPPIALGAAALVLRLGVMFPPNLFSGRGIGKVMPIVYISTCHPLKSDVPSIQWLLIFFSCLIVDVLLLFFSYTISSSQFHNISHSSRPFFSLHNFGLGLFPFWRESIDSVTTSFATSA